MRRYRWPAYSGLAGYEEVNDDERRSQHRTFRLIGWENIWQRSAGPASPLQSFEREMAGANEKCAMIG